MSERPMKARRRAMKALLSLGLSRVSTWDWETDMSDADFLVVSAKVCVCSYQSHRLAEDEDDVLVGDHARRGEEEVGGREVEEGDSPDEGEGGYERHLVVSDVVVYPTAFVCVQSRLFPSGCFVPAKTGEVDFIAPFAPFLHA